MNLVQMSTQIILQLAFKMSAFRTHAFFDESFTVHPWSLDALLRCVSQAPSQSIAMTSHDASSAQKKIS